MPDRPYNPTSPPCVICKWQLAHIDIETGICRTCRTKATIKSKVDAAARQRIAAAHQRIADWNAHWDAVEADELQRTTTTQP